MKRILVCGFIACVLFGIIFSARSACAQEQSSALDSLSLLSRRGQLAQLIQSANSLLASGNQSPSDQGITLAYVAYAHQQTGDLRLAIASYNQALAIINRDGHHTTEYATALAGLATIYAETGQADTAKHILLNSIHLFEQQNDHTGAATIWNDLATLAADGHSIRDAHKYLARALAESQLTSSLTPDELAALASTQARIAQFDRDPGTAISAYQRSLALWKQSHGEQQTQTGWLYVLLGGAFLDSGDIARARDTTLRGLNILEATSGRQAPRFFAAQLAYAKVLEASGAHDEASNLRTQAQSALDTTTHQTQGQISIAALR